MPYGTRKKGKMTQVFNKSSGKVYGTHSSKDKANKQLAALHIHTNECDEKPKMTEVFQIQENLPPDTALKMFKTGQKSPTNAGKVQQALTTRQGATRTAIQGVSQIPGSKMYNVKGPGGPEVFATTPDPAGGEQVKKLSPEEGTFTDIGTTGAAKPKLPTPT